MGFTPSAGHELQTEFLMPREVAGQVIEALSGLGPVLPDALQVFEMRTIAGDELWLSPSRGRDSVAAHFTWHPEWELVRPALERVESVLAEFDPRPHWGKVFLDRSPQEMDGLYAELPRFRALRDAMDPDRRFGNAFVEGLIGR
jgi:xylitol oxidase